MDKKHRGRPKGRTKKYNIHTAISTEVGARLREWLDASEFKPQLKQVLEVALTEFLDRRTAWELAKPNGESEV